MKKLPDEIAACRLIKRMRKYNKTRKFKTISIPLNTNDAKLSSRLSLEYNPSTEHENISSHGLVYKRICIYPTTKQKLKCINKHAIDYLEKQREAAKIISKKQYEKKKYIKSVNKEWERYYK